MSKRPYKRKKAWWKPADAPPLKRRNPNFPGHHPGWVYLLRIENGPTKIGVTFDEDPTVRANQIDYSVPYKLERLGLSFVGSPATFEARLHREFDAKWLKGEWFTLDASDIECLFKEFGFRPFEEEWASRSTRRLADAMRRKEIYDKMLRGEIPAPEGSV